MTPRKNWTPNQKVHILDSHITSHGTSLCLSFLLCEMGITTLTTGIIRINDLLKVMA